MPKIDLFIDTVITVDTDDIVDYDTGKLNDTDTKKPEDMTFDELHNAIHTLLVNDLAHVIDPNDISPDDIKIELNKDPI